MSGEAIIRHLQESDALPVDHPSHDRTHRNLPPPSVPHLEGGPEPRAPKDI